MPTVRLEFELDSEVYPELHAALVALRSTRARGERIRQLASAGLVWENVRIHGAATLGPTPGLAPVAPARVAAPEPAVPAMDAPAMVTPRAASPAAAPRPERRSAPRPRPADVRGADFIDLAIDAPPSPVPPPAAPRAPRRELEAAVRNLPVLMDVVTDGPGPAPDDGGPPGLDDAEARRPARRAEGAGRRAAPVREAAPVPPVPPAPVAADDDDGPPAEALVHLPSLSEKPASRSRLMRMKERGLFKNDG